MILLNIKYYPVNNQIITVPIKERIATLKPKGKTQIKTTSIVMIGKRNKK